MFCDRCMARRLLCGCCLGRCTCIDHGANRGRKPLVNAFAAQKRSEPSETTRLSRGLKTIDVQKEDPYQKDVQLRDEKSEETAPGRCDC